LLKEWRYEMAAKRKPTNERTRATKGTSKEKPNPEQLLEQRTREIDRLKQFVDESTFSSDERELTGELSVNDQHPGDVADFVFQRELMETTREILDEEATQARDALERKAAGQYGICAECGQPIPKARLAARPHATLCIDCQREREGHRQARAS
jgi:phage/conjugal plasmid C-4 type zinc finger TraR family protein